MKSIRAAAFFTAAIMAALPAETISFAESSAAQSPVYTDFNENDVNGRVIIELPDGVTAHVEITFDSPEGKGLPYYSSDISGSTESGIFDIEGRDKTDDDYRTYNLSLSFEGGQYGRTGEITDTFTVYDPNDNPDSFTNFEYVFTADDAFAAEPAELTEDTYFGGDAGNYVSHKEYTLHLGFMLGDVTCDGIITGSDATMTLVEYTLLSSSDNPKLTFSTYQNHVADVTHDGIITGSDATKILQYYTLLSSNEGVVPDWDKI